jgi:tetratricopeptide (TPR) repeat protein
MHYSSAFELTALALAGKGEVERAVQVLEDGVTRAPDVWLNWQLLGNYRSDLERYEAADSAYQRALACPNVNRSSVRLNQAILAGRMNKPTDALLLLEEVVDNSLTQSTALVKGRALHDLGRSEEAWQVVTAAVDTIAQTTQDFDAATFGHLVALSARIMLDTGEPRAEVRQALVESLGITTEEGPILNAIREIDDRTSPDAKYYRLLLDCSGFDQTRDPDRSAGYFISADVVADNADEAVSFVAQLHAEIEHWRCTIDELEMLEERPNEPKGVYRMTKRHYYDHGDA